jgi:hypothetical protein
MITQARWGFQNPFSYIYSIDRPLLYKVLVRKYKAKQLQIYIEAVCRLSAIGGRSRFDISASLTPRSDPTLQTRIYARSRIIAVFQQKGKFKIWKALYVVIT